MLVKPRFGQALAALLMLLVLGSSVFQNARAATVWDTLDEHEKKKVLAVLKDRLPSLLPEGATRDYSELMANNVESWSRYAGQISVGEFDQVVEDSMRWGQQAFLDQFQDELDRRISSLNLPASAMGAYEYLKKNKKLTVKLGRALLNGEWRTITQSVYDEAKGEATKRIGNATQQSLRRAYNWVFEDLADFSKGAVTPFDVFLKVVELEVEYLPKWRKHLNAAGLQTAYENYLSHGSNWTTFEQASGDLGFNESKAALQTSIGTFNWPPALMRSLFESCRERSIATCVDNRARRQKDLIDSQRSQLAKALSLAGEKTGSDIRSVMRALQSELNRAATEVNVQYQQAVAAAQKISDNYKTLANQMTAQCNLFNEQRDLVEGASAKVRDAESAVGVLTKLADAASECATINTDVDLLVGDVAGQQALRDEFERHLGQVESMADVVCAGEQAVRAAQNRTQGQALLQEAIDASARLPAMTAAVNSLMQSARTGSDDMRRTVDPIRKSITTLAALKNDTATIDEALFAIKAAEQAKEEFDSGINTMRGIVERVNSMSLRAENINPVEMNLKDRFLSKLPDGLSPDDRRRIGNLIRVYKDMPDVQKIMTQTEKALDELDCADSVRASWSGSSTRGGRYSSRRWRDAKIPDDLVGDVNQAQTQCGNLPALSTIDALVERTQSVLDLLERDEIDFLIPRKRAEQCLARAVIAQRQLPDVVSALQGQVSKVVELCRSARDKTEQFSQSLQRAKGMADALPRPTSTTNADLALADCHKVPDYVAEARSNADQTRAHAARAVKQNADAKSRLAACKNAAHIAAADGLSGQARQSARQAVASYHATLLANQQFDIAIATARAAAESAQLVRDGAADDTMRINEARAQADSALQLANEVKGGFDACVTEHGRVKQQLMAILEADAQDERAQALAAQLASVSTQPGVSPDHANALLLDIEQISQSLQTVLGKIDADLASLRHCINLPSPYDLQLAASEAILSLSNVGDEDAALASRRSVCLKSDAAGTSSTDSSNPASDAGSVARSGCRQTEWGEEICDGTNPGTPIDTAAIDAGVDKVNAARAQTTVAGSSGDDGVSVERPDEKDTTWTSDDERNNPAPPPITVDDANDDDFGRRRNPELDEEFGEGELTPPPTSTATASPGPRTGGNPTGPPATRPEPAGGTTTATTQPTPTPTAKPDNPSTGINTAQCSQVRAAWVAHATSFRSLIASAGDDTDGCALVVPFNEKLVRLSRQYERVCGEKIQGSGIEGLIQAVNQQQAQCARVRVDNKQQNDNKRLNPGPFWAGASSSCSMCAEAIFHNCERLNGEGDRVCADLKNRCPKCQRKLPEPGLDRDRTVYRACMATLMYSKSVNRPEWDMDTLRKKASPSCPQP